MATNKASGFVQTEVQTACRNTNALCTRYLFQETCKEGGRRIPCPMDAISVHLTEEVHQDAIFNYFIQLTFDTH